MKKIPTLYVRDPATNLRYVRNEVHPECQWVIDGEGVATRKWDGTCVAVIDGELYARREVKRDKAPPPDFVELDYDEATGKTMGWEPADHSGFAKHIRAAYNGEPDGTYELCGPKINGNPEGLEANVLIPHGEDILSDVPSGFDALGEWLHAHDYEGVVWWGAAGQRAKIKAKDFPR